MDPGSSGRGVSAIEAQTCAVGSHCPWNDIAIPVGDLARAANHHAERTDLDDGARERRTHHPTRVGALRAARPLDELLRDNPRHFVLVESGRLVGTEGTSDSTRMVLRSDGSSAGPQPTRAIRGNTACGSRFRRVQRRDLPFPSNGLRQLQHAQEESRNDCFTELASIQIKLGVRVPVRIDCASTRNSQRRKKKRRIGRPSAESL